ncbi:TonB-dependent receptor [Sphingomonas morindae]|uniref:TonB-dependent receptor n=1 Tax=Sphingomonas morindae TaxID=1541170 RepID=A0ABY4XD41_9SPHN|nr:TonB-dependent receptor [Sphingomonas morindae]USI74882.1 TonB-dependent receptor [Sphingomonas morindae]
MSNRIGRHHRARLLLRGAIGAALVTSGAASLAQLTTATLRGTVSGANGAPVTVTAQETGTGLMRHAVTGRDGSYTLPGLRPGSYTLRFEAAGLRATRDVTIGVGQSATLDIALAPAAAPAGQGAAPASPDKNAIIVTATRLVETRTSEVATNVTTQQIQNLPQSSRNFLNFAQLAPGVRVSTNPLRKTFSGGSVGQDPNGDSLASPQVNVFIDGVSLKSDIQQGGIVGGDSSRGNPFPQAAVQEFRVLSSNFKAEYEDAGTAVISAVTKSGGNSFHGEAFGFFQLDSLRAKDYFQRRNAAAGVADEGKFSQKQYGASLGGPIIKDRLHFFVAYEANEQKNVQSVTIGQQTPDNIARFGRYQGSYTSPFREDLGFAKLSLEASEQDRIDLSGSIRKEHEMAGFGGQTAYEAGSRTANTVYTGRLRWQHDAGDVSNEASLNYLYYKFDPSILSPDQVGQNFDSALRIGGASTSQKVVQKGFTLRDAVTISNVDFLGGNHVFKTGFKLAFQDYTVNNALNANPVYNYANRPDLNEDFSQPFEAQYGVGNPEVRAKDTQLGLFAQDDWRVTDRITLNLGLRWDYETNAKNNDYVTPPDAAAALRALEAVLAPQGSSFRAADYISTGKNRKPFLKAIQPRVGASYDLFGDQRTVVFIGWGRYYDRTLFRNAAEEALFRQYTSRSFQFSKDGLPRNGQPTILWNPAYLTGGRAALDGLIASSTAPAGELRIIRNDVKPPHTDQFSLGVRQKVGRLISGSISYQHADARDQVGYYPVNRSVARNAAGFLDFIPVTGFSDVVAMTQARASKYDAMFVTFDKAFTRASPWSLNIAYTLAYSKERGYSFNFDFPDVAQQPFRPNAGNERHRVVVSGLAQLPLGFQISSLAVFGSGQPFLVTDQRNGAGAGLVLGNYGNSKAFRQVDVRLTKDVPLFRTGAKLQLIAELFNIFNRANFAGYDGFLPQAPATNPSFGVPNTLAGPPRTFQFGARLTF